MDWRECVDARLVTDGTSRFKWPSEGHGGFDCSVNFTVSDVSGGIQWIVSWPGDFALSTEPLKTFFEIGGEAAVGATGSLILGYLLLVVLLGYLVDVLS